MLLGSNVLAMTATLLMSKSSYLRHVPSTSKFSSEKTGLLHLSKQFALLVLKRFHHAAIQTTFFNVITNGFELDVKPSFFPTGLPLKVSSVNSAPQISLCQGSSNELWAPTCGRILVSTRSQECFLGGTTLVGLLWDTFALLWVTSGTLVGHSCGTLWTLLQVQWNTLVHEPDANAFEKLHMSTLVGHSCAVQCTG